MDAIELMRRIHDLHEEGSTYPEIDAILDLPPIREVGDTSYWISRTAAYKRLVRE